MVLITKISYFSLLFENTIPREIRSPENLRHCIYILRLSYGPSLPGSAIIKIYKTNKREMKKKPTEIQPSNRAAFLAFEGSKNASQPQPHFGVPRLG